MRRAAACGLLLALLAAPARSEESVRYGPLPDALAAVEGDASDEALAAHALETLESTCDEGGDAFVDARALLVLLEDVGLRHVAARLARGDVPARLLPHLLYVVASSPHPAAQGLLVQAADERRAEIRMLAADGLGVKRGPPAVETLAALARDPVPGVRAAALRALFAHDAEEAVAARQALPVDARPDLHARRLRWHRLRGHASAALLPTTLETWRHGRNPAERTEAALLLILPALGTPVPVLEDIVQEMGTDALGAAMHRFARGVPRRGYDARQSRLAAIFAAFQAGARGDDALRARMLDRMVGWLAEPVRLGPFETSPPEDVLRMVLPDYGEAVAEPTLRRLRAGRFDNPTDGVDLLLEAVPREAAAAAMRTLLDPAADPRVPTEIRVAAVGALSLLDLIGDEALARALFRPEEEAIIRRTAVRALGGDDAEWAIPLLGALAMGELPIAVEDPVLAEDAVVALESRPEEAARRILERNLFERTTLPEVRMEHLVQRADEEAFSVLDRALRSEKIGLRCAALRQLYRLPVLRGARTLGMLRAYEPAARDRLPRTHELQQVVYAYLVLAPREGVRWMREHWDEFVRLDWAGVAIRSLQNVPPGEASDDMVDLVLDKVGPDAATDLIVEATKALEGRFGHRDADVTAFWRRALTHGDPDVVRAAVTSLDREGYPDLTDLLVPLYESLDLQDEDQLVEATDVLDVLRHQPVEAVEPLLLGVIVDANLDPVLRQKAAVGLLDRVSPEGRAQLLLWLTSERAGRDVSSVSRAVARVVGSGAGADVAAPCYEEIRRLLFGTYDSERALDPEKPPEGEYGWHIGALAHAIAFTRDEPTIGRVLDLVFEERFARFARNAVARQRRRLGPFGPTSIARPGPNFNAVWQREDGLYAPMPWEISQILENLKPVADDVLAAALDRTLLALRQDGRLAAFPDLYLDRVVAHLRERATGDRARAAAVVARWMLPLEPVGGTSDFMVLRARVDDLARSGLFDEAARAQAEVLALLERRAYDDEPSFGWRLERSAVDAWRGAAAAAGRGEDAEGLFERAVRWNPYDIGILRTAARARGLSGVGLDTALALVERAATLERRAQDEVSFDTADVLAAVLLRLERYDDAAAVLQPVLRRLDRYQDQGGRYHLRAAEALTAAGRLAEASEMILKALALEPSLDEAMRVDPWLAPLRESGRLDALVAEAEQEALAPQIE